MKPLIHILYEEMKELLWRTMSKFVKSKHLSDETEDEATGKTPAIELLELVIKIIDIGTKAKLLFLPSPLELDKKRRSILKRLLKLYEINN